MSPAPTRGPDWVCECGTTNGCDRTSCIGCKKPRPKDAIAPFEFPATGQQVRHVEAVGGA